MDKIIEIDNLTKIYRGKVVGIKDLSLDVKPKEIYGFLGRNGAGKTTTIRLLLSLIFPTSGSAKILGFDIVKGHLSLTREIGYIATSVIPYRDLTGKEFLDYMLCYYGKNDGIHQKEMINLFEVSSSELSRKIKSYSTGMARKLTIIQALQHNPRLLILDEPTEGLDPLMQYNFYEMLKKYKAGGGTVFISSHHLREVEQVCDRAAIIRNGMMVAVEEVHKLISPEHRKVEVIFAENVNRTALESKEWEIILLKDHRLEARLKGDIDKVIKLLAKFKIKNLSLPPLSLEDVFLRYYKEESDDR